MTNDGIPHQPTASFIHLDNDLQDQPNWSTNVPAEKLIALMHASNAMMQSSFRRDRNATLKSVARHVFELLHVEASGIFLVSPGSPDELVLEATVTDVWGDTFEAKRLKISHTPNSGMTSYIAAIGKIVRLHGADLENHPNNAKNRAHLSSGASHSLLGIPLKNRKEKLLGVITASNKKNANGVPTATAFFDEIDESIARILASQVVVVLENLRVFETLTKLLHQTQTARDLAEILHIILSEGINLLDADRGEIVLWDEAKHDLIITAQFGESITPLLHELAPTPSIVRTLWHSHEPSIFIPDVAIAANYHAANPQTKCEIAARLQTVDRGIGVINVESFKSEGLDEQDIEVLELLAQYAAIAYQVVGKERRFRDIVAQLGESRPSKEMLTGILESVRDIYRLGSSIIYIADDTKHILRCSAFINEEENEIDHPEEFSYLYEDIALATEVFRTKVGYFCEEPSLDPIVNRKGLTAFKIRSPIAGVPLIFDKQVVGVLVGWSNSNPQLVQRSHIEELKPFARLAAANIAVTESEQKRKVVLTAIQDILAQMQTELSLEKNLRLILHGVQAAGFDRVRVYQTDEENDCFVALDSLGMSDPVGFIGRTLLLSRPYTQLMMRNAQVDRSARIYDPRYSGLGPDPDAINLGKQSDLPWATVPLMVGGKFYGQITADNAATRKEITSASLEYLTLLGALAAQAIANARLIDLLGSRTLPILSNRLSVTYSTDTVVRILLVYLTAGEALGFSRALYLKFDEKSQSLHYKAGLGSVAADRHAWVSHQARETGIAQIIDRASELIDRELDDAMQGFVLDLQKQQVRSFLQSGVAQEFIFDSATIQPAWVTELNQRIGTQQGIIVPVRSQEKLFGLFVVDRQWQAHMINETDKASLLTFAHLAAANLAISESEQSRTNILQSIRDILLQMQKGQSFELNVRSILKGVQATGFDRARIWKYTKDSQRFVGVDSIGMGSFERQFRGFLGQSVPERDPFLADIIASAKLDLRARKYTPDMYGPHAHADSFGLPPDQAWAAVPLVIGGQLYGFFAADNAISRHAITAEHLEYMSLLGALAALEIANTETISMLRASKLKDEFLQRMAHIFGTSTTGVKILTENIRKGIVSNERALQEYIPAIAKANERFLGLAQNLIDFAALREDTKLNIDTIDLIDLLEDAINLLQPALKDKQIKIQTNFPKPSASWRVDSVRTTNTIESLLDNAIKFAPPNSIIHIALLFQNDRAHITVRDEGPGIPEEDRRLIFDSFYRGQIARERHVEGTGLGLAIVSQTMKLHGGAVEVRNHPKGGAEFTLTFPKILSEAKDENPHV